MNLDILKIASDTKNHKKLDDCTHKSKHKNPLCGDEMEVGVKISKNKILDFAYQCKSCIYCQASVSLLSKKSINVSINKIKNLLTIASSFFDKKENSFTGEWTIFNKIFNKKNISRKECIILPFKTLSKALGNLNG